MKSTLLTDGHIILNTDVKLRAVSLCLAWDVWIAMQGFLVGV